VVVFTIFLYKSQAQLGSKTFDQKFISHKQNLPFRDMLNDAKIYAPDG
jgi:hypothetical protein